LYVFFNNGDGTFTNRTDDFGIYVSGYSILFGDVDNDADLDMFLIRNDQKDSGARPELYLNDGVGNFTKESSTGIEVPAQDTRGAGLGDIDNDGDLDLYIACKKSYNYMLRNDTETSYHYIDILAIGPGGDYGGFGSKVSVYEPGHLGESGHLLGYQESVSNIAYLCQNQTALHFGLREYTTCDIRIVLTDGSVHDYLNIAADQFFVMGESHSIVVEKVSGDVLCNFHGWLGNDDYWVFEITMEDTSTITIPYNKQGFRVYPNPAGEYVIFEFKAQSLMFEVKEKREIQIMNVFGQEVARLPVKQEKTVWDCREEQSGIYFYRVEIEGILYSGKVVVQ